jgi:tRNA(fMet)-specific endonuclease VapC
MRHLLDTDTCIHIARDRPTAVRARFARMHPGNLGISVVTWCELVFGAVKSSRPEASLAGLERFAAAVRVHPLTPSVAPHYGSVRKALEDAGTRIEAMDLLIAAHALDLGAVLVTNNTREFSRVPGLRLENWVE